MAARFGCRLHLIGTIQRFAGLGRNRGASTEKSIIGLRMPHDYANLTGMHLIQLGAEEPTRRLRA